jgi:hypothetical protein
MHKGAAMKGDIAIVLVDVLSSNTFQNYQICITVVYSLRIWK